MIHGAGNHLGGSEFRATELSARRGGEPFVLALAGGGNIRALCSNWVRALTNFRRSSEARPQFEPFGGHRHHWLDLVGELVGQ